MFYINPPEQSPENIAHQTFFSKLYNHEVGYNVYLPPGYEGAGGAGKYPVAYHLHGWTGNESSELAPMENVYRNRRAITVFPNSSPVIGEFDALPVESMLINELMPIIDSEYRTIASRDGRSISGFSMGGGMAFCYAIKNLDLFSAVTAYAGTYHHYFHKGSQTVGPEPEKAAELYSDMIREERFLEEGNVLCLVRQNAEKMRSDLEINMHIGTKDILFCDNEILRLHLESLGIPHKYRKFDGAGHDLDKILLLCKNNTGREIHG